MLLSLASIMMPMTLSAQESYTWDFESEEQFDQWISVDYDNDGFEWQYFSNEGLSSGLHTTHGGNGIAFSASYDNETQTALTPDNWLISPEVTLGGVLSLWACGQDANYPDEVFGVYVCVDNSIDPADFVQVGADVTATGEMTEYTFDLSGYAGQTGRFAIRHYNVTDMYQLNIDDVTIDHNATFIPDPTLPTNITVAPSSTTANVTWDGAEGDSWNLRYKVFNPKEAQNFLWDITVDNYQSQLEGWVINDADGDGKNWGLYYGGYDPSGQLADEDNVCWGSASYDFNGGGALTPDNWLITPILKLGGTFKFMAMNDSYPDILGVYVMLDEEGEEIYQIGEDFEPSGDWSEYSFDTSEYDGQEGRIVIRHYNCEDQLRVFVDYLSYEKSGEEPGVQIEIDGLTEPSFTIPALKPGTEYIVEVQAYNTKGITKWTTPTHFTTTNNGITTGIKTVGNSKTDHRIYNLNGQQVNSMEKGIYISNGKKVVKK